MAAPQHFDVWFVAADTVYRGVPYGVVTGWAEQGRVAADDKVRPAGTTQAWVRIADHPLLADFLFRPRPGTTADAAERLQPVEMDVLPARYEDHDEDVDMIPLIDISLVLLIFFMMTTAVAALSPVDVPDMRYASEPSKDKDAITIHIDKRSDGEVFFAVRVGDRIAPEDTNLATPEEMLRRLDARLDQAQRPPEVRVACHRELERGWVRDVARELHKRREKGQISSYSAEVNEQKP
jgi:biopolymer transport protein ExbD